MKRIWISLLLLTAQPAVAQQYKPSQWITVWQGGDETYSIDYNRVKRSGSVYTVPMVLQSKEGFSGWAHIDCKTRNYAISGDYGRTGWNRGAPGSAAEALADVLCKTTSGGSVAWQGGSDSGANAGVRKTISEVSATPPSTGMVLPEPMPEPEPTYSGSYGWRMEGYLGCLSKGLGASFCRMWFD